MCVVLCDLFRAIDVMNTSVRTSSDSVLQGLSCHALVDLLQLCTHPSPDSSDFYMFAFLIEFLFVWFHFKSFCCLTLFPASPFTCVSSSLQYLSVSELSGWRGEGGVCTAITFDGLFFLTMGPLVASQASSFTSVIFYFLGFAHRFEKLHHNWYVI